MHVRKKILTKYRIITSKSSADLLMPRTTWFTAFVRCNTKHIYKSKIKSKKKLNCDRETCNQSVEFHNGSGRTDCIPRQTRNFIKLEMAKNSFHTLQPGIFRVLKNKLTLFILKQSHTLIDQKIADFLCQCYWEIQSNSFWGQPRQTFDRFVHNFRISFFETEAKENCFWSPQLCCQNQKLIGLIQEHNRNRRLCHKERGSFKGFDR